MQSPAIVIPAVLCTYFIGMAVATYIVVRTTSSSRANIIDALPVFWPIALCLSPLAAVIFGARWLVVNAEKKAEKHKAAAAERRRIVR